MVGIVKAAKVGILTVNCQCILDQVICSDAEKVNEFCKLRGHDGGSEMEA